jgi:UDP-glucose 4-epimerase
MNVLVTGGAGFIGSHLADACLGRGDTVTVLDDLSTGRLENIAHLLENKNFRFVRGSIMDAALVRGLVAACDVVFHIAAALGMRLVVASPLRTFETNVLGSGVVFETAAALGKRVLFTSTSECYGLNERKPSAETDLCVLGETHKSRWSYAYAKAGAEVLAMAYHAERNLPVTIVRLFNTVGPRQTGQYGMVIPTFVRQALVGEPLTVHGDGWQSRCFGDVYEIVPALCALADHPGAAGAIFNLGNDREVRIGDLARRVIELTGSKSTVAFVSHDRAYEPGFDEIKRRVPDITKARTLIGFNPQTQLDTILERVIAEQRQKVVAV